MSIEEKNEVDLIGTDKETGAVGLLISDHLEWDKNKHPLLKDKVNAYLDYIESGQLERDYPDAKDRKVYIELVHHFEPDEEANRILARIKTIVAECDVTFTWSQWVDDSSSED